MRRFPILCLSLVVFSSLARAAVPHALVLPGRVSSTFVRAEESVNFDRALRETVSSAGYENAAPLIDPEEISCVEPGCLAKIAAKFSVEIAVGAVVELDPKSKIDVVRVELFERAHPAAMRVEREPCRDCTMQKALERVERLALTLLERVNPALHDIPTRYQPVVKDKSRTYTGAGAALLAVGVLAIAGGGGALAINGKGTCRLDPPATQCESRYATLPLGGTLVGVGAAAAIGGAVLVGVGASQRKRRGIVAPQAALAPGLVWLGATWTY